MSVLQGHIDWLFIPCFQNFPVFSFFRLWSQEWTRLRVSLVDDPEEERKLVYGMLFAVKEITMQMTPSKEVRDTYDLIFRPLQEGLPLYPFLARMKNYQKSAVI